MQMILAWIKKYILHIKSPYAKWLGYDYEWDYLKRIKADIEEIFEEVGA